MLHCVMATESNSALRLYLCNPLENSGDSVKLGAEVGPSTLQEETVEKWRIPIQIQKDK